jgi:hypothetical protein
MCEKATNCKNFLQNARNSKKCDRICDLNPSALVEMPNMWRPIRTEKILDKKDAKDKLTDGFNPIQEYDPIDEEYLKVKRKELENKDMTRVERRVIKDAIGTVKSKMIQERVLGETMEVEMAPVKRKGLTLKQLRAKTALANKNRKSLSENDAKALDNSQSFKGEANQGRTPRRKKKERGD